MFRQDFTCLAVLFLSIPITLRLRGFHTLWLCFPNRFHFSISGLALNLGSSAFARRYLQNRFYFLFLRVLRYFNSPGSPHFRDS